MIKKTLTKIIDYSLSSIIIIFSLIYSISHMNLWGRLWESIKDVGSSAWSYGSAFYADEIHKSSVMQIPKNFTSILPFEWDEFVVLWKVYWQTVFTKESFMLFISHVGFVFEKFSKYFMPAILIAVSLVLAFHFMTHDPFVKTYDKEIKKIQLKIEKAKTKTTKKITKILSKGATVATVKKSKVKKTERMNRRLTKKIQKYTKKIQKIEKKKKKLVKVDGVIRSIPFRFGQKIKRKFINPVIFRLKHFFKFFFKKGTFGKIKCGIFFKIFVLIWAYNWNVLTIAIETVAYLLYFCSSDKAAFKIYTVLVKLLGDATVLISFFSPLAWTCIAWILIEVIRRNAGKNAVLKRHEKDEEILEEYDGEILLTGRQGKGKSTTGAHMTRLVSEMFRNKYAKPDLLTLSAQFPYFSWITLENFLTKNAFVLNRKEVISKFVEKLKFVFYSKLDRRDPNVRYLKNIFHYRFKNYIFDYDYEKYGLTYNNGIRNVDIFETIENYAELYFVYSTETSHIFGIVPVREDFYTEGKGFFKVFKYDYYQKPEESERHSKFCHIANQNSFRLGKTMQPNEPFEDGYEFGIEYTPEKGKERGNQLTNRATKADDDKCNPNNDGYEDEAKMMRHIGNIFFRNYRRRISDEQRAASLQANDTQLCTIFEIKSSKDKVVMPFFWIGKDLMKWWRSFSVKKIETIRYYGREFTFFGNLWLNVINKINRYFDNIENKYGVSEMTCNVYHGMDGNLLEENLVYYRTNVITRNNLTRTDSIRMFYRAKVLSATGGINEFPCFSGLDMTTDEMHEVKSHFYEKLLQRINTRIKKQ